MLPKLFEIGPLPIHTYGLLLATAFLAAISLTAYLAEREGVPRTRAWDLGFVIIISAVLGGKLVMVLTDLSGYLNEPSRFLSLEFWQAGGVFYGGLLGGIVGSAIFVHRHRDLNFWIFADAAAPAIALGQTIGRLGCFSAGCDYGKPTDVPWAVTFTSEYAHRTVGVPLDVPLHPTQLYESGATLVIFLLLLLLYRRKKFSGQVFSAYLLLYAVARFILEFYRGDADRGFVFGGLLSTSQFIGVLIVPVALAIYFYRRSTASGAALNPAASRQKSTRRSGAASK